MHTTSAQFRDTHKIIFSAPVRHFESFSGFERVRGLQGDYLDLDNNGIHSRPFEGDKITMADPRMSLSMDDLRAFATQHGKGEVLTNAAVKDVMTHDVEAELGFGFSAPVINVSPFHSLGRLTEYYAPRNPSAKVAIDLTTNEFLIYDRKR